MINRIRFPPSEHLLNVTTSVFPPPILCFSKLTFIFPVHQEAALRCKKTFSVNLEDKEELLKKMLDWAFKGFKPTGPDGLKQAASTNGINSLRT